jgi:hypothetical protein
MLSRYDAARDVEVRGAGLEEAFLLLTTEAGANGANTVPRPPAAEEANR